MGLTKSNESNQNLNKMLRFWEKIQEKPESNHMIIHAKLEKITVIKTNSDTVLKTYVKLSSRTPSSRNSYQKAI